MYEQVNKINYAPKMKKKKQKKHQIFFLNPFLWID